MLVFKMTICLQDWRLLSRAGDKQAFEMTWWDHFKACTRDYERTRLFLNACVCFGRLLLMCEPLCEPSICRTCVGCELMYYDVVWHVWLSIKSRAKVLCFKKAGLQYDCNMLDVSDPYIGNKIGVVKWLKTRSFFIFNNLATQNITSP
jgi:hypothetical protein